MKTIFLIPLLLLSIGAFGQCCQSGIAPPPMTSNVWMPDHSQRASHHGLRAEYDLREVGTVAMARGERPLWEVFQLTATSLGDAARDYRNEHVAVRKARIVWEQDGKCTACLGSVIRRAALQHIVEASRWDAASPRN
jgi:hypothetical protein